MDIEKKIWKSLEQVMDPEVPLNLVEMGLIYDVNFENSGLAKITMTLTTPGCPLHSRIKEDITANLLKLPDVKDVDVNLVFDPQWTIDMMTPEARKKIGK